MILRRLAGILLLTVLAGCDSTSPIPEDRRLSYRDGSEYFWPTTRGLVSRSAAAAAGATYYFQIDSKRVCWAFEVPGTWQLGREAGVLRRIDGKGVAAVWLFGLRDIDATSMEDAIRKAAAQSDQQFVKHMPGARSTLTPYPRMPGAWQWTLPARTEESGRIVMIPPRWYLPVGDTWLAQFTLAVPPGVDADAFVGGVLQSLTTSREARCYEARMRELGALR